MAVVNHLLRRGGTYYWRRRVPRPLVPLLRRSHLLRSLRTKDPASGAQRARQASVAFDRLTARISRGMASSCPPTAEDIAALLQEFFDELRAGCERVRATRPCQLDVLPDEPEPTQLVPEDFLEDWISCFEQNDHTPVMLNVEELLERRGLHLDRSSAGFAVLCRQALRVGIQALTLEAERDRGVDGEDDELMAALVSGSGIAARPGLVRRITSATEPRVITHAGAEHRRAILEAALEDPVSDTKLADYLARAGYVVSEPSSTDALGEPRHAPPATGLTLDPEVPPEAPDPVPARAGDASPPVSGTRGSILLSQAIEDFVRRKQGAAWGGKSFRDAKKAFTFLMEFFGDRTVGEVRASDARLFREQLMRVPRLNGKGVFAGLTMEQAIERADAIEEALKAGSALDDDFNRLDIEDGEIARLAPPTINKHLTFMIGLFDDAIETNDLTIKNPFRGLLLPKRMFKKERDQREAWTDEEIVRLFATPIWTGCRSCERRAKPGDEVIRDARFWVPLLGAFAGLRLEEACQLLTSDIEELAGGWCIQIQEGKGKLLKSEAAQRSVPVHSTLRQIGFLQHVHAMRSAGEARVFPDLERSGPYKLLGYSFSKFFTSYRRAVGMYEARKDFHSFRHSFDTHLQRKGVRDNLISQLLGHKAHGETSGRYFKGFLPANLIEAVEKIDYGAALEHLVVTTLN